MDSQVAALTRLTRLCRVLRLGAFFPAPCKGAERLRVCQEKGQFIKGVPRELFKNRKAQNLLGAKTLAARGFEVRVDQIIGNEFMQRGMLVKQIRNCRELLANVMLSEDIKNRGLWVSFWSQENAPFLVKVFVFSKLHKLLYHKTGVF